MVHYPDEIMAAAKLQVSLIVLSQTADMKWKDYILNQLLGLLLGKLVHCVQLDFFFFLPEFILHIYKSTICP